MEEYERAYCIWGYHEYKELTTLLAQAFVHDSLLHRLVCKSDHLCWQSCWLNYPLGSGRPPFGFSSFKLTLQMRTSSELSQEQSTQTIFVCMCYFRFTLSKCILIFRCRLKNINIVTPNFPIYMYLSHILKYTDMAWIVVHWKLSSPKKFSSPEVWNVSSPCYRLKDVHALEMSCD